MSWLLVGAIPVWACVLFAPCTVCINPCSMAFVNVQGDSSVAAGIHRSFGDQLYAKHDYDAAVQQYLATIGFLEPSYVIRKFLDAQRINNLTLYLEALHDEVWSTLVHETTLPLWRYLVDLMNTHIPHTCTLHACVSLLPHRVVPPLTTPRCCSIATQSCRTLPSWTSLFELPMQMARRSWRLTSTPLSKYVD